MNINEIIEKVYAYYRVKDEERKTRKKHVVDARRKIIYILRTHTNYTYDEIGANLGVGHDTSIYHFNKFKNDLKLYSDVEDEYNRLKRQVFKIDVYVKESELINFAAYLTGKDKDAIELTYEDWKK